MRSILHFEWLLFVAKCGGAVWVHRVKVSHDPVTPSGSKSIFLHLCLAIEKQSNYDQNEWEC